MLLARVLVKPERDVEVGIVEVLGALHQCVAALGIVQQLGVDALRLQAVVVEVRLVRRHAQVARADQEDGRRAHVLNLADGRSIENFLVVRLVVVAILHVLVENAGENPVRDVRRLQHVRHVEHSVPKTCGTPKILVGRMANEPASQEATVASSLDAHTVLVDVSRLHGSLSEITTVMHVLLPNLTKELIHEVLAKADGASIVHDEHLVAL